VDPHPSAVVVASWPKKWCEVKLGMMVDQAVALMGSPTKQAGNPDTDKWAYLVWYGRQTTFLAEFRHGKIDQASWSAFHPVRDPPCRAKR
jgi:hypothetical protein